MLASIILNLQRHFVLGDRSLVSPLGQVTEGKPGKGSIEEKISRDEEWKLDKLIDPLTS